MEVGIKWDLEGQKEEIQNENWNLESTKNL